nr:MAG TPA: hypothetical protein [Crassvirales sp.]
MDLYNNYRHHILFQDINHRMYRNHYLLLQEYLVQFQ